MNPADVPLAGEAVYLYCFSLPGISVPQVTGVDEDRGIQALNLGGLSAVVGSVALADFTGETGELNLQNIAWLGPRACRHAAVVEQVMARAPVFPLPFGTLFSSLSALEREIDRRHNEVAAALEHVTGCQEWSVEVSLDRARSIDCLLDEGLQTGRIKLPEAVGRRHLEEKKLRRQLASELNGWADERLASLQNRLEPIARDFRPRRFSENLICHWAYLVPSEQVELFRDLVGQFSTQQEAYGLAFRLTGPWPPYTFCQPAQ